MPTRIAALLTCLACSATLSSIAVAAPRIDAASGAASPPRVASRAEAHGAPQPNAFAASRSLQSAEYDHRLGRLAVRVSAPYTPAMFQRTALDSQDYNVLNPELRCPKILDVTPANRWAVVSHTGGPPVLDIDRIDLPVGELRFEPCVSVSQTVQSLLDQHYRARPNSVNRLEMTHRGAGGPRDHPTVLALTPDGLIRPAGAITGLLQGGAVRLGFIDRPFSPSPADDEWPQLRNILIEHMVGDTLRITADIHSPYGEGVVEWTLRWDERLHRPIISVRLAATTRPLSAPSTLGFVGHDFMRGPVVHGWASETDLVAAFHDGRNAFLVEPSGAVTTMLLVPPFSPGAVEREEVSRRVRIGSRLIVDQAQLDAGYYSKSPQVRYEHRADIILTLTHLTPTKPIRLLRAQVQTAVEANETVNLYLATEQPPGGLHQFGFDVDVVSEDFARLLSARRRGMAFLSGTPGASRLMVLSMREEDNTPVGLPFALTDATIARPHRPATSHDGRWLVFDADVPQAKIAESVTYVSKTGQRTTLRVGPTDHTLTWRDSAVSLERVRGGSTDHTSGQAAFLAVR